uniref:Uncharacterized protein n=1 Tax=viral metagenome TaxID=1070528 RepID=A0A6M3IEX5_9ZZZZ
MKKGKMVYVPPVILEEAEIIAMEKGLGRADALRQMTNYSRVGREMERIMKLDWTLFKRRKNGSQ